MEDLSLKTTDTIQTEYLNLLFRNIKPAFYNQANPKTLRFITQAREWLIAKTPLFSYIIIGFCIAGWFWYNHLHPTALEVFFLLLFLTLVYFISKGPIKRAVCYLSDRLTTKTERDYQEDIAGFLNSISPLLGKHKTIELPGYLNVFSPSESVNTISLKALFTKRLIPENICLVLLDRTEGKFFPKTSLGLKQDEVDKVSFTCDCRLIHWLKKLRGSLSKEKLSQRLPKDRYGKIRYEDIEEIKEEMALIKAEVCTQIYYSTVFIGFLSLGRKLVGRYTEDELIALSYLSNQLNTAIVEALLEIAKQGEANLKRFNEYVEMLHKEMVLAEAERVVTGADEKLAKRLRENHLLLTWYLFEREIHQEGLTAKTQDLMQKDYDIELPLEFKLNPGHSERVRLYLTVLVKELLGLEEKIKLYTHQEHLFWLKHQTEWFDGSGYPDGLAGEKIPILSRIVSLAEGLDIFSQALRDIDKAIKAIENFAGTKFDPTLIGVLKKACRKELIP